MKIKLISIILYTAMLISCKPKPATIDSVYDQIIYAVNTSDDNTPVKVEVVSGHRAFFGKGVIIITKSGDQCQIQHFRSVRDHALAPSQNILNIDYRIELDTTYQTSSKQLLKSLAEEKNRDLTRPVTTVSRFFIRVIKMRDTINFSSRNAAGLGFFFRNNTIKN